MTNDARLKTLFSNSINTKKERREIANIYRESNFNLNGNCKL